METSQPALLRGAYGGVVSGRAPCLGSSLVVAAAVVRLKSSMVRTNCSPSKPSERAKLVKSAKSMQRLPTAPAFTATLELVDTGVAGWPRWENELVVDRLIPDEKRVVMSHNDGRLGADVVAPGCR